MFLWASYPEQPQEFEVEAIRLIVAEGRRVSEVARELGIGEAILDRWKNKYEEGKIGPFPGKGHLSPEGEELRRLGRENKRLRMEQTYLKKQWPSSRRNRNEVWANVETVTIMPFTHLF